MDDLVQWLGAQLDEDERTARAASWTDDANTWHAEPSPFGARDGGQRWYVEDAMDDGVVSHVDPAASADEGVARHIASWNPARVLREIDAKRQVIARYEQAQQLSESGAGNGAEAMRAGLLYCLMAHAVVYADRPGYRDEWRP